MEDFFAVEEDEKPKLKMPLFSLKKKEETNDVADVFSMDNEEDKKDKPKMPLFSKNSPKREEISEKQDVEQEDEMDVYFKSLNDQIQKEDEERKAYKKQDIYEEDDYLDSLNDKKSNQDHKEDDQDYDSDELANKENFDLPPLDHDKISYEKFQRNFYKVHPDIEKKNPEETKEMRKQLDIRVMGDGEIPCPVETFEQMNLHSKIYDTIKKEGFVDPTPIQRQSIPVAMTGRNCICISKTGSGKTAAFLIPMIHHILGQRPLNKGEGPIAVIVATSRELAKQIYKETKKFTKKFKFGVCALFGGVDQKEQILLLKRGCEVVVSTPGRLVHFMRKKYFKPFRISYLVLDEADRMFDMGFEPQVRSIVGQIRPDRQTLLFSATFKKPVEGLARDILKDPVRINVGAIGAANLDVQQMPVILPNDDQKWIWLLSNVDNLVSQGNLLIFVTQKDKCDFICSNLVKAGFHAASLHGDKSQQERQKIMFAFTNSNIKILVATDVIARGMDIKEVNNVICYDVPRNLESHTHRIGRTGRAGKKGVAWSLISQKDFMFASFLVRSLEGTNQNVPEDLMNIALKDQKFVKSHNNAQRNSGLGFSSNNNNNKKRKQDTDDQYENPTRFSLTESDLEKSKQYSVDLKTNSLNSNFVKSSSSYNTVKAKQPVQQVPPKPILISNLSNSFVKSKKPEDDNVPYDPSQPTSNTSSSAPKRNRWDQK